MEIGQAIQQGEVYIRRLADRPDMTGLEPVRPDHAKGYILAHSESGHHHILSGGDLLERPNGGAGMDRFYAILDNPETVEQDAANPHDAATLPAGFYDIRISREYNPFTEQARRVAD